MTAKSFPEDVSRTQKIDATAPIGQDSKTNLPPQTSFQTYMQSPSSAPTPNAGLASPFNLPQQQAFLPSNPTMTTLLSQATAAQTTLGDINSQLSTPNLKLKQSSKYLLKNKLTDANGHLATAGTKLGLQPQEPTQLSGPFGKFIGLVTDGQNQMRAAQQQLQALKAKGDQLSPADMLLVQVKLNLAQQELEYSSVVLSKAIDDMKQLFNVQL
jgi:hypothetical protein